MTPLDAAKALAAVAGVTMTLYNIVQHQRTMLPEGEDDRREVERCIAEAVEALKELWLYEPQNPRPGGGA
jgi:hypothetical protein